MSSWRALGRKRPPIPLWLFLFYAALAAATLGANPFRDQTITPFDRLVDQRAWSFVDPSVEVRQRERSDILNALVPQWTAARKQLRAGHLPLWNDTVAGGIATFTANSTLFTPAFAIFAATPDPAAGFYLAVLVNLAVAGLGMHLFLRRRLGWLAAMTGASTFELCGFIAAWLYWPHVLTLIWAPWLLWAIDRCADRPAFGRSLAVAVATALLCLGGFPFVSVLTLESGALYTLVLWFFRRRERGGHWKFAGWYTAGTALGLLFAALPLLGLVFWLEQLDLGYRAGRGSYLTIHSWRQLLSTTAWEVRRVELTMYVGAIMEIFAIGALIVMLVRWRWRSPLPVFGLLLLTAMAGLVFGLWPMWLIGRLPGMAFNSWSRAIGLMDLALIVMGAVGIDCLWRAGLTTGKPLLYGLLVVLAIAQVSEMAAYFRSYNGPVSSRYYFPTTQSIQYMSSHAGPFDYVIADRSFDMSGTLGAYGLKEWLAHSFRSQALQDVLHRMAEHPFYSTEQSPARFPSADIRFDSPVMATFNVRYAAIDSRDEPAIDLVTPSREDAHHIALPAMPQHRFAQTVRLDTATTLAGVSVRLATYRRSGLQGRASLSLLDGTGTARASASLDTVTVVDNAFARFRFDQPVRLPAGNYTLSLGYAATGHPAQQLTAWSYVGADDGAGQLRVDDVPYSGTLDYQLWIENPRRPPFHRVFAADGTAVFENKASPNGPYFIERLGQIPDASSSRQVHVDDYLPGSFTLTYDGGLPGYVVVPMNIDRDWKVQVNGKPARYELKAGVLPAVPVTGSARLSFNYEPAALRWLLPWLAALVAALVSMGFASRPSWSLARIIRRRMS